MTNNMADIGDIEVLEAEAGAEDEKKPIMLRRNSHADLSKILFSKKVSAAKLAKGKIGLDKHHSPYTFTHGHPHESLDISDKIYHWLHNKYVHMVLSFLLLIDILIVIISISLELVYLESKISDYEEVVDACQAALGSVGNPDECSDEELGKDHYIHIIEELAVLSLSILSLFLLESVILMIAKP